MTMTIVRSVNAVSPTGPTDVSLVARIAVGDDRALQMIYERYSPMVYGLARRVTASTAHAEEITQEVFVYLWQNPDRFDAERGTLRAFLGALTHRRAVDEVRRNSRRTAREDRVGSDASISICSRSATISTARKPQNGFAPRCRRCPISNARPCCSPTSVGARSGRLPNGSASPRVPRSPSATGARQAGRAARGPHLTGANNEVFGLLAAAVAVRPPDALGDDVVRAAQGSRPSGQPIESLGGGRKANPAEGLRANDRRIRRVVDHRRRRDRRAVRVERDATRRPPRRGRPCLGRQLGLWQHAIDESLEADHLAMTEGAVRASVRRLRRDRCRWSKCRRTVCNIASLDAEAMRRRIKFHMLDTRVSTVLVVRIFEVWTHIEDLCRALRRDAPPLDAGRLHLMTRVAVAAIPLGMLPGKTSTAATTRHGSC